MGGKSSKQKTERELPSFISGTIERTLPRIEGGRRGGGAFSVPRETLLSDFIPLAPQQLDALEGIESLAREGTPIYGASEDALMGLLNPGDFTESPGFQSTVNRALQRVVPGLRDPFSVGGGGPGGLENFLLGEGVTQATGNIAADQYNRDRATQMAALGMAPQVAGQRFDDMMRLLGVGETMRGFDRERLLSDYGIQQEEADRLKEMIGVLQPFMGLAGNFGTTTTTDTPGVSPLGAAASLALMGAGTAGSLGWRPFAGGGTPTGYGSTRPDVWQLIMGG